jgi:hydrogenase maturation factor
MNLMTGKITEMYIEEGSTRAKVSVGGAQFKVVMTLLMEARVGDEVFIDSGVAISRVNPVERKETSYVFGNSR